MLLLLVSVMLPGRGLEMRKAGYSRRTALIAVGGIAAVLIIVLYFATASPAAEQVPDPAVSSSISARWHDFGEVEVDVQD